MTPPKQGPASGSQKQCHSLTLFLHSVPNLLFPAKIQGSFITIVQAQDEWQCKRFPEYSE